MEKTVKFGIIGRNISYSFSKKYFSEKFKKLFLNHYSYEIFDLQEIDQVEDIFKTPNLHGLNVTIPYKEKIIPFLDELNDEAQKIGAVNCISIKDGIKKGYNTDAFGFQKTLELHKKDFHQSALVLGDGGAAKAVKYIFEKLNIPYKTVARNSAELHFENLTKEVVENHHIIVQCTPVGTFPNIDEHIPFPFDGIGKNHLIIDLIYNPEYTAFIKKSMEKGAKTANGYFMLEQQAEKAWEIWNF